MQHLSETETALVLYLTVKDRRTDLGFVGHAGYSVAVIRPNATDLYAATVVTENDRYTRLDVTLGATLEAGEYPLRIYSMSAPTALEADRLGEVERDTLVVTRWSQPYIDHTITESYVERQPS